MTRDRELEALERAVRWPGAAPNTVMVLAGEFMADRRDADGFAYFSERARQVPDRTLFLAMAALFQARLAPQVPLLRRVAWVEDAIAKLDRAAAGGGLERYLRGVVFAELPERFGRARQAVEDLEWMLDHADQFPPGLRRGAWRGLAQAYALLGRTRDAEHARGLAGPGSPLITDYSVNARDGFRFGPRELVEVAPGIYVARGYDFADLAFVVTSDGIVAIDAGTTEATAREALAALRTRTNLPIRHVLVTHAHWDHIGGLPALVGPGTQVVAQARFAGELALVNRAQMPFRFFFGAGEHGPYRLSPDRVVSGEEVLQVGDTRFVLLPARGGETDDALLVDLPDAHLMFVGDAFMPYIGAPFVPEGSVDGLLATIEIIRARRPSKLVHGHTPLTENFTPSTLGPLAAALTSLRDDTLTGLRAGRTLPELLATNLLPPLLAQHPDAVVPYLLMRDNVVARLHAQSSGYWQPDGEGMEVYTRREWGAAIDLLAGGSDARFAGAVAALVERGDFGMALRIAEFGLAAHPDSAALAAERGRALDGLRTRYQFNPFKFLIYSEMAGVELGPPPPAARAAVRSSTEGLKTAAGGVAATPSRTPE